MTETASPNDDGSLSVLTVDLGAIAANYALLVKESAPAECAAVVKADAYGLGLEPVARTLERAGCRTFFVATLDEGLALRNIVNHDIYVFAGVVQHNAELLASNSLRPVLNDLEQLRLWRKHTNAPAAVHIDTGMNRLGFPPIEVDMLRSDPTELDNFTPKLLVSHLACADEPTHAMNAEQLERFRTAQTIFPNVPASLSASSGVFLGPEWHFEMVRPGFALYGGNPQPTGANPMQTVARLKAKILQCRAISSGESVGYGATFRADTPRRIATISTGYADGFLRALSNKATAYIGENPAPLVGRVSMDLIGIDITGIDGVKAGDWVDLLGPNYGVDALARDAGTIGYEILTALGQRHRRVYLEADA
ncbi:MAG TPA: alanine racemase [Rhodospirillaceae bacterium]|nr:alanine racemase [Rhodospirillaceae bacterium]MBL25354.1 alanine racemase [Rhodospirillaceae bacterium]HAA91318.1 alanine racemase [Rhodospirillaceae bacterium]HAT34351.1 alanine racemase [Rhodospirillaceae bacterium]